MAQAVQSLILEIGTYLILCAAIAVIAPNLPQIVAALKGE